MGTGFDSPVRLSEKIWIFVAAAVVLCNYYFLYFVNFQQGAAGTTVVFSSLKVLGTALICSSLLKASIRTKYQPEAMLLLIFLVAALFIYAFKVAHAGFDDVMFFNTIMCTVPFLLLKPKPNLGRVRVFFECCTFIVVMQILVDVAVFMSGHSLWENKAFVGGLGNPSSFGLICNILICYILFKRRSSMSSGIAYLILSCGVYLTSSMLAVLSFVLITGLWLVRRFSVKRFFLGAAICLAALFVGKDIMSGHIEYKLRSVVSAVFGASDEYSASVSIRIQNNIEYAENFAKEPVEAFLYGFTHRSYMSYDSQVLTYASSFGIFISLFFFLAIAVLYIRIRGEPEVYFASVMVLLFCITFLTNRIMDYYPVPIFLLVIICLLEETMARGRRVDADVEYNAVIELKQVHHAT